LFTSNLINEFRYGYQFLDTTTSAADPSSEEIHFVYELPF
jgi:hypothetical protein